MSLFLKSTAVDMAGSESGPVAKPRTDELLPLARAAVVGDDEAAGTLVAHVGRSILEVVRRVLGEYQVSVSAQNADIGMRLSSWLACVALAAGHLRERPGEDARFWWRSLFGRLGAGVDFSRVSPQLGTQAMAATLAPAHWSAAFVVRGTLGTSWALGARAALDVQIFADAFPTAVHYDVNREGSVGTAFSPWRVRPGLALGLAYR